MPSGPERLLLGARGKSGGRPLWVETGQAVKAERMPGAWPARSLSSRMDPSTVDGFAARIGPRWVERRDLKLTRPPARPCLARIGAFRTQGGNAVATPSVDRVSGAGSPARARRRGGDQVRGGRRFGAARFIARHPRGPM